MTEPAPSTGAHTTETPLTAEEDKLWATIAHLGGIFGILPSLIIFLALRRRGPKTATESKEALNWQITFFVAWLIVEVLVTIIGGIVLAATAAIGGSGVALPFLLGLIPAALWIVNIVFSVLGGLAVNSGRAYRYPFAVRLVR